MQDQPTRSTSQILTDTLNSVSGLVRGEVDLARAELAQSLRRAVAAAIMLLIAALLALVVVQLLAGAAVAALVAAGLTPAMATLAVAGALALVALVLGIVARNRLSSLSIAPRRTARSLARDAEALKEAYND